MTRGDFMGAPLDCLTMDETLECCVALIGEGRPAQHVVLNASKCVLMRDDPRLRGIVASCDLVNADGMSVVLAGRFLGLHVPERVAGIDLMERLFERAETEEWPVFLLGAHEETVRRFAEIVRERWPNSNVVGIQSGYFTDDAEMASAIAASGARLLFVGMSSPRKEYFLAEQLPTMGPVFAMGVGGSFEVWTGNVKRAPGWMQRWGLEWAYRFAQEPGRMWRRYLVGNARFAWMVLGARVGGRPLASEVRD